MLRRLAVLLFVLAITGQALASICMCLNGETKSEHSCCKREKSEISYISRASCCDTDCNKLTSESSPRSRTEAVKLNLKFEAVFNPAVQAPEFVPAVHHPENPAPFVDQRVKFSRPPALYIYNCAFLI